MSGINNRKHQRLKHSATIRVCSGSDMSHTLDMRDFSEGGMFLLCNDTQFIQLNDEVTVQTMELEDAPILRALVVRIEESVGFVLRALVVRIEESVGFAVTFMDV